MRWIIVALIYAGSLFAQPLEGPYLIYHDTTQTYFGQPVFVWQDSITARIYYGKNVGEDAIWGMRRYSLTLHRFAVGEDILRASTNRDYIDRLIVSENRWAVASLSSGRFLFVTGVDETVEHSYSFYLNCNPPGSSRGSDYDLIQRPDNAWTFAWFGATLGWDGEPSAFCGVVLNISDGNEEIFLEQNEVLDFPILGPNYLSIIALDSDSFAVFHNKTRAGSFISLLGHDSRLEDSVLSLDMLNGIDRVWDVEWLGGTVFNVLATNYPATDVYLMRRDISNEEQGAARISVDGDFGTSNYCRVPGYGWALAEMTDSTIRLLRVDSNGQPTANPALLAVPDQNLEFEWVKLASDTSGSIFVYYGEVTTEFPYHKVVKFVSLHWDTPLDAREPPSVVPSENSLSTYPNPFNSSVRIDYELPRASDVRVSIFNTLGQEIETLIRGRANAGTHTLNWSPKTASGVYFVTLKSSEVVRTQKILYIQ